MKNKKQTKIDTSCYHRKTTRLKKFNYASPGYYFITICTQDQKCHFGNINAGIMHLNPLGQIAKSFLKEVSLHFTNARIEHFVIMPNHVHFILRIFSVRAPHVVPGKTDSDDIVGTSHVMSLQVDPVSNERAPCMVPEQQPPPTNQFAHPIAGSVSVIVQQYKSSVTRWCKKNGHNHFKWQSRFFDHVIRSWKVIEK